MPVSTYLIPATAVKAISARAFVYMSQTYKPNRPPEPLPYHQNSRILMVGTAVHQRIGSWVVRWEIRPFTALYVIDDFYGTTCLHGLHVTTGSLGFGIL